MKRISVAATALCCAVLMAACSAPVSAGKFQYRSTSECFGTFSAITAKGKDIDEAWREIKEEWRHLDRLFSVYREESDVCRFNAAAAGEKVSVDPATASLLFKAAAVNRLSGGAYNPTVGGLVDLWAFSPRFRSGGGRTMPYDRVKSADGTLPPPAPEYIAKLKELAVFDFLPIEREGQSYLVKPARSAEIGGEVFTVTLDLGGIAKGLAAARAAEILRLHKIGEGYVSVGRSSLYILTPQGMDVAATDPLKPETQYICFKKCRGSVATSGSYENRYRSGGIEYSHIIDGKTGMPIPYGALTASVIGGDAATADALATALCAMKSKDALELMASPDFPKAALLRDNGGTVKLYTNMEEAEYELFNGAEVCFIPRKS